MSSKKTGNNKENSIKETYNNAFDDYINLIRDFPLYVKLFNSELFLNKDGVFSTEGSLMSLNAIIPGIIVRPLNLTIMSNIKKNSHKSFNIKNALLKGEKHAENKDINNEIINKTEAYYAKTSKYILYSFETDEGLLVAKKHNEQYKLITLPKLETTQTTQYDYSYGYSMFTENEYNLFRPANDVLIKQGNHYLNHNLRFDLINDLDNVSDNYKFRLEFVPKKEIFYIKAIKNIETSSTDTTSSTSALVADNNFKYIYVDTSVELLDNIYISNKLYFIINNFQDNLFRISTINKEYLYRKQIAFWSILHKKHYSDTMDENGLFEFVYL